MESPIQGISNPNPATTSTVDHHQASLPNFRDNNENQLQGESAAPAASPLLSPTEDAENRPPPVPSQIIPIPVSIPSSSPPQIDEAAAPPPLDVISADPITIVGDPMLANIMEVDISTLGEDHRAHSHNQHHHHHHHGGRSISPSRFVPGPLREEPTLKEKLVDRERQRRKEAERARLKRQFALMSNGGGLVYDNGPGGGGASGSFGAGGGAGGGVAGTAVGTAASITGTVGEESTHADMEDSITGLHHHPHGGGGIGGGVGNSLHQGGVVGGGDQNTQLGYTMERFLQETKANNSNSSSAARQQQEGGGRRRGSGSAAEVAAAVLAETTTAGPNIAVSNSSVERRSNDDDDDNINNNNNVVISVIREEAIEADPKTAGAPDKGVVMERFLNGPVVVDTDSIPAIVPPSTPPPPPPPDLRDETQMMTNNAGGGRGGGAAIGTGGGRAAATTTAPDDVHRSVSFDMELRTTSFPMDRHRQQQHHVHPPPRSDTTEDHNLHLSIDDSNASVRVEVAPEDDHIMEPPSPGGHLSVPSEVAPSSIEIGEQHLHRRQHSEMETSLGSALGSVGPSIDGRQSLLSSSGGGDGGGVGGGGVGIGGVNNVGGVSMNGSNVVDVDTDDDEQPRVLRLTEAEIQEMAAIEEASIGNAPPSDRDAESLVGDLVGTFGTPNNIGGGEAGTNFSQETPTTAMESMSAPRSSSNAAHHEPQRGRSGRGSRADDMDQNSIDDTAMSAGASVSSHLVVSPGASVSGSAVSVTANPPSEIIGRGETTIIMDDDDTRHVDDEPVPPPPSSVVVENGASEIMPPLASPPVSVVAAETEEEEERNRAANLLGSSPSQPSSATHLEHAGGVNVARLLPSSSVNLGESRSAAAIREELKTSNGPPAEEIVNRRLRPGMVETAVAPTSPLHPTNNNNNNNNAAGSNMIINTPNSNHRTVDEFDFDKHDLPMTPRSLMSDSLRDLPGEDELWTSPGSKMGMMVSPIHRAGDDAGRYRQRRNLDPHLVVPTMPTPREGNSGSSNKPAEEDGRRTVSSLSQLACAFHSVRINNSSTTEAKELELYSRGSIQSNALEKRLLPLLVTIIIEVPVLRMIVHDPKLCTLLGRQHYQLLLGFLPIIAAISANSSSQASLVTTTAICHGHVTPESYYSWMEKECKVAVLIGVGTGAAVGMLALSIASGDSLKENVAVAAAIGMSQCITATLGGCIGVNSPVLMGFLLKNHTRSVSGLFERALVDLFSTALTTFISYCILLAILSPVNPVDACMT